MKRVTVAVGSRPLWELILAIWLGAACLSGNELARLRADKSLTPENLLGEFADFTYELGEKLQDPETFLKRKRGDCDDFARLAGRLLAERDCSTRLVVVMMGGQTHVVCYVVEAKGYLDFNRRADANPVVPSDGSLEDIGNKVAASFRSPWWMISEIEYRDSRPVFVDSVFPPAPATMQREAVLVESSPDPVPAAEGGDSKLVGSSSEAAVLSAELR